MSTVIKIENLSKKYVIGHQRQEKYTALRDVMMHKLRGVGQRFRHPLSPNKEKSDLEDFWALKDINLEIKQGDRVGIIGRNGAGKSTLLKILSRITEPTTGHITINGRVASLLEVGTGFHPELTGRENIFLNGAILGMGRIEIKKKFDEIVDFAGVGKFLDTPVKRYSSGMYVRLAFAVAAHLEPEILLVDEVLAVGDADFQKKCLGKMQKVSQEGRTILFVSHNLPMISRLCPNCALLVDGKLLAIGDSEKVMQQYTEDTFHPVSTNLSEVTDRTGEGGLLFERLDFLDEKSNKLGAALSGAPLTIRLYFHNTTGRKHNAVRISVLIKNMSTGLILLDTSITQEKAITIMDHGFVDFHIERLPLTTGEYYTSLFIEANRNIQDWIPYGPSLLVEGGVFYSSGRNCVPGYEGKQVLVEHKVKFS